MAGTNIASAVTPTFLIRETTPLFTSAKGEQLALSAECTGTIPTTADVFAHGCVMTKLDTATSSAAIYENTGSSASPVWTLVGVSSPGTVNLTQNHVLVGDVSNLAADVAMSGDATIVSTGALTIANSAITTAKINNLAVTAAKIASATVTRTQMSAPAGSKIQEARPATIATTGNTDAYMIVGESGTLSSADFSAVDALATDNTNYVTFSITNLGQAGSGTTVLLAATDANTTKTTGGSAIAANTKRALTLTGTGADLVVTQGDRLRIRVAAAATSANTVTFPVFCLRFSGTT